MYRLAALSLLLLAACAPAAQSTDTSMGASASTTMAASPGLTGNYSVTFAASDFPAPANAEMRSDGLGTWTLAFHEGNHFVVNHRGTDVVQGHYQSSGNQVMFGTGETGPYACNIPATYNWVRTGNQLTFTLVGTDACEGRVLALTTRPFTRTP